MTGRLTPLTGVLIRLDNAADQRPVYFIPSHRLAEFEFKPFSEANHTKLDNGPTTKNIDKAWFGEYGETPDGDNLGNNGQARFRPNSL